MGTNLYEGLSASDKQALDDLQESGHDKIRNMLATMFPGELTHNEFEAAVQEVHDHLMSFWVTAAKRRKGG